MLCFPFYCFIIFGSPCSRNTQPSLCWSRSLLNFNKFFQTSIFHFLPPPFDTNRRGLMRVEHKITFFFFFLSSFKTGRNHHFKTMQNKQKTRQEKAQTNPTERRSSELKLITFFVYATAVIRNLTLFTPPIPFGERKSFCVWCVPIGSRIHLLFSVHTRPIQ